jgi:hypothetical protein
MKFSGQQKEELLHCIHNRRGTVQDDIESATPFESVISNLDNLEQKIKNNSTQYTDDEVEWMVEEFSSLKSIADDNLAYEKKKPFSSTSFIAAKKDVSSIANALHKLKC